MEQSSTDTLALKNLAGLRFGHAARIQGIRPELLLGLMILADLCSVTGTIVIITSVLDGHHMRNSLHYTGSGVDFVIGLTADSEEWVLELQDRLGSTFDVIDEGDHIHMEYQPHTGATN